MVSNTARSTDKLPRPIVFTIIRFFVFSISKVLWRIKLHNKENIPQDREGGLLIVPNHQTYFDPFWVCLPIRRRFRFMAWDKAFDWFIVGKVIRYLGAFPVSLKRGGSIKALKKALKVLRAGDTLIVFPEGEREFSDGKLLDFSTGALRIASEANVPILPVTIRGGNKVWSQDHKFPRFGKVEIIYHPIVETSNIKRKAEKRKHIEELNNKLKSVISSEM